MLQLSAVQAAYGQSQVLHDVTLEVRAGEVVTLMGRNGMGKTTTIRAILGLMRATSGSLAMEGADLTRLKPHAICRLGIGLVPEGRHIFPTLTVRENLVATAANRHGRANPWTLEGVFDLFPGLAERANALGSSLSGGEQQMLAVGRALMTNPKLLVLDEATEGLAPLIREAIFTCLEGLKARGQSILLVDKNVRRLMRFADRHYIIEKGSIVWTGSSADLSTNETIWHRYLGV
ncbi:MAG: ABC transporter ATP-binding protein [Pseudomonadota bacterium]